ncbi:MAG: four helix bundle protein [Runella slithyformis]|nr:MAG: four helix bundle protein [Runella slithyformis]
MQNYKNLIVWQKSHQLTLAIFSVAKRFPKEEQFILTSQLKRACLSVVLNIVEGCGKYTDADTANFFQTSLGSVQETEYCILLSKELGYIDEQQFNDLSKIVGEVKAMLITIIKKIRERVK